MSRLVVSAVALALLVVLPACDSGGPDPVGLSGTWEGVVYDATTPNATRYPISFRLTDSGLRITGSGEVSDLPSGPFTFAVVNGQFLEDLSVTLELEFTQPPFMGRLAGRLVNEDPGRIEGTFSGSGETGNSLVRIEITSR